MNHNQRAVTGLNLLLKDVDGFSQAQAAWRFYNNPNVEIESLSNPLLETGIAEIEKECDEYVLIAYDWSHLDYRGHGSKRECIQMRHSQDEAKKSIGYDFQSSLAISDKSGAPITPLIQNLKTQESIYSNYSNSTDKGATHLEELFEHSSYIHTLPISKKRVDIIDREGDSIMLFREYATNKDMFFIIRAQDRHSVTHHGAALTQKAVASSMDLGEFVQKILYKKEQVCIYVNETEVCVTRDGNKKVIHEGKKATSTKVKGESVTLRFVAQRLVNANQEVVATWLLLTNLPQDISSKKVALWYYYRWKIESYFKLLKSSGFNLEQWQQREPLALFKRILVSSYACVLVWKIANSNSANIEKTRKFLVQLSRRLVEKKNKIHSLCTPSRTAQLLLSYGYFRTL